MGHFVSWPMEGQSSTSRSGWGHHRGPVSTGGGVFSSGGKWKFLCLFPSKSLSLTDSENTNPNTALSLDATWSVFLKLMENFFVLRYSFSTVGF